MEEAQKTIAGKVNIELMRKAMREYLSARGEPARYLHLHCAGLIACEETSALKGPEQEFDEALRKIQGLFESVLKDGDEFVHYSTGESVETGMWDLDLDTREKGARPAQPTAQSESFADRVEVAIVTFLQKKNKTVCLEIETDLYPRFPGLLTPSKGMVHAVLNSYARKDGESWKLREEDLALARREEMNKIFGILETLGEWLNYQSQKKDEQLIWKENDKTVKKFHVLASALISRALENADEQTVIVIPGGRAALAAYKQERDPVLKARLKKHPLVKYRLLRSLLEVQMLTRETFYKQIASDPVEASTGQMMMF